MKRLTALQAAYIAGIVDGEGCISISRSKSRNLRRWEYTPIVNVTNTNTVIMEWLLKTTGIGNAQNWADKGRKANWKPSYRWALCSYEFIDFLIAIQPYLVIKGEQCELMLEFLGESNAVGSRTTEENDILRRVIWSEMADLNKRGI